MSIEKSEIEGQITKLQQEAQELVQERAGLQQRAREIEARLGQIQGGLGALMPLIKKEGTLADKLNVEKKKTTRKRSTKKS